MTKEKIKKREWIGGLLERLQFVEWDRFTVGEMDGYQYVDVYGWIERDDDYKDFVWTRFWPNTETVEYTTSSDEYSEKIQIEWFGKDSLDNHNSCRRVEHGFEISNAVELTEQATLTSDGGRTENAGESGGQK